MRAVSTFVHAGFGSDARLGSEFHFGTGLAQRGHALVATLKFLGNGETFLQWGGVGLLGFGQKLIDLALEALELPLGTGVADGGVFARVGEDFGAVDGYGDLADFEEFAAGGEFQNLGKSVLE